jgi:erythromycin esterase
MKSLILILLLPFLFACEHHTLLNQSQIESKSQSQSQSQKTIKPLIPSFNQALLNNVTEINATKSELSEADLEKFVKSIGNARIIALGEQTHGAGSVFTLKTQLIKYLHQHHDFDLFILESGIFDVDEIRESALTGTPIKENAPGNIFYMYSKTDEVMPLFDYLNNEIKSKNPLNFVGFDSQHTGEISNKNLLPSLVDAIELLPHDLTKSIHWSSFSNQLQKVLNVDTARLSEKQETLFFTLLSQLQTEFFSVKEIYNNSFWYRITKGLEAQAKRQWRISDNRSQEMGENVKYWAEKYPNKKILIWAHTWHLTHKGIDQINAGQVISEAYTDDYFMIHFTAASGEYLDFIDMEEKVVSPLSENSLEKIMEKNTQADISFLNIKSLNAQKTVNKQGTLMFGNNYKQTLKAQDWPTYFDGVFFLKNIKPANFTP